MDKSNKGSKFGVKVTGNKNVKIVCREYCTHIVKYISLAEILCFCDNL